ncbi:hypothetical protein NW761_010842 [Fusarium oxysporum]|nr:hypothetical protein NW758_010056 [Fusarium oxysporum]KAJ4070365.1 hypothetical protein NW753_001239 [Fusarium oxysporum]KAJ4080329.1 hypothetical protein NW761_010842 [Fusarium oxysporum]KAJ4102254.1 hypothetical protein NW756_002688 [Fusarium oxysporum]KAJ4122187.1 hypothetical protein NW765_005018 [Fusarium oxysporum]
MSDDGQELVTKPFKFVTAGKPESLDQHHHYHRFLLDDRLRLRDPGDDTQLHLHQLPRFDLTLHRH